MRRGDLSGEAANEPACEGTRALDGGDSRLHPRIIADDDTGKAAAQGRRSAVTAAQPLRPEPAVAADARASRPPPTGARAGNLQDDIDAMLSSLNAGSAAAGREPAGDRTCSN